MTALPKAAALPEKEPERPGDLLLGEDWVSQDAMGETALRAGRTRRRMVSLNRSPLARKIIIFNLMALVVQVAGVLFFNPFRDTLVLQREQGLVSEAQLIAQTLESSLGQAADPATLAVKLKDIRAEPGVQIFLFDAAGVLLGQTVGTNTEAQLVQDRSTVISDFLNLVWDGVSRIMNFGRTTPARESALDVARKLLGEAIKTGQTVVDNGIGPQGGVQFSVAAPIVRTGQTLGVVALTSAEGEIDKLVRYEREQILQMFVIALFVSIGLSLVLASTIANPLSDLAAAAELGRDRDARRVTPGRVRIPDLAARPDEIGRLSVAMRGMVAALYDRIDANEQFAADVAHEIKNPLASLRSAVGSMRMVKKEEQREKLLEVIEHDVRRLDRLVSDISNASRLDSELVKEEEEEFNLLKTLSNLTEYLGKQANEKGVDFITDFPAEPIVMRGLEARLAQVFVNLITNAISFCEDGDAVRVWARRRENRVLVVVEDTGPGIPEQALTKIFKRFYSERPKQDFGNHSGLGLAISKQIVEAHGGVIWAENIRPTSADLTSDPLGARFVVGLPV